MSIHSLVGRIDSNLQYRSFTSIAEVAALYAEAIVNGHVFQDGNKPTGLATMLMFLDANGYAVIADEIALADCMVDLATHTMDQHTFGIWLNGKLREL